ncbi:hypothetical protein [Zhihengliuella salsuginis]|uniref:ABC transporter permease n=1 Tax=Zhihengliuella salsuginis TaxID=578222 RepID=A0ABQ3G9S1_9MICC|nr:hypothetical protein [Zhihengliuella salsuginis]GHC99043.1 hypothetical protein GCM10008096_00770 [Zhihengliuella salsuginis]
MSTATTHAELPARHRPGSLSKIVRLHFVDRSRMIDAPLLIMAGVAVLIIAVMLVLQSFTDVSRADLSEGFRYNQAAIWCLSGYIMNVGVMAYARTMPYAMGLGATRRQYFWGTTAALALEALIIAAMMTVFLFLEKVTGHWFTGARMFDTYLIGDGDYSSLFVLGFGIALAMLFLGSLFAAVYMRWGPPGVIASIAVIVLAVLGVVSMVLGFDLDVIAWFTPFAFWKVAGVLVLVSALAALGSWGVMRRVPVGR